MRIWWNLDETAVTAPAAGEPGRDVVCFGPYRLDRLSGRLFHGATHLPLRLKTFAVLEYLATRPDRLVRRDELLDAVWPKTHVTPSVLAGCIRELRRTFHDDARKARFIETAHRRGYRFIGAVGAGSSTPSQRGKLETLARDADLRKLVGRIARAVVTLLEQQWGPAIARRRRLARTSARRRPPAKRRLRTAPRR